MNKDEKKTIVLVCIAVALLPMFSGIVDAYNWPIKLESGEQYLISGTLGDCRTSHLHKGVDMPYSENRPVYSVKPGLVSGVWIGKGHLTNEDNSNIIVGDFRYVHIKNYTYQNYMVIKINGDEVEHNEGTSIAEQNYYHRTVEIVEANSELIRGGLPTVNESSNAFYVPITEPIGLIRDYPPLGVRGDHLHFEEKDDVVWTISNLGLTNRTNPLRDGGLTPFNDDEKPKVEEIMFVKQDSGDNFTNKDIYGNVYVYGQVDIKAHAYDKVPFYWNTNGIYKIGYRIQGVDGGRNFTDWIYNIEFDRILNNYKPELVYDTIMSKKKYVYWVTNSPAKNKCWDTTEKYDTLLPVSLFSVTAQPVPPGAPKFPDGMYRVLVRAEDIRENPFTNSTDIRVDNYRPSIIETDPEDDEVIGAGRKHIEVRFSEEMDTASVEDAFDISPHVSGSYRWSGENYTLYFEPDVDLQDDTSYTVRIITTDARDVTGKELEGNDSWSFRTAPKLTITNVNTQVITPYSAIITWDTNNPHGNYSSPIVYFGQESGQYSWVSYCYPFVWIRENGDRIHNMVLISHLYNDAKYYFKVQSIDEYCQQLTSSEYSFTTLSPTDHRLSIHDIELDAHHNTNWWPSVKANATITVWQSYPMGNRTISGPFEGAIVYGRWHDLWGPTFVSGMTDSYGQVTFNTSQYYMGPMVGFEAIDVIAPGYTFWDYQTKYVTMDPGITIMTHSPVDILVRDPDGLTIGKEINEIPNASYYEINLTDGSDIDDVINIPEKKTGDYIINVIPEPNASPTETYTLEVVAGGINITLAENVQIGDMPSQPYVIESTEEGINLPLTAYDLIEDAMADLEAIDITNKHDQKDIDEAIKHIGKSLQDSLWLDASHLDPNHGHKVFDEDKKAVKQLMKITEEKGKHEDTAIVDEVKAAIEKLTKADEQLVIVTINDAKNAAVQYPKNEGKVDKEIAKAEEELAKAAEEISKGNPDKAIDHYKKAWEHAQHAIEHAQKLPIK